MFGFKPGPGNPITKRMRMYLLGYDIGSSSVKAALVDQESGWAVGVVQYPPSEMPILSPHPDWAEQEPEQWWENVCTATQLLLEKTGIDPAAVQGIGISYQMHGLVAVDEAGKSVRPAIIWCDSRAVETGNRAFKEMGETACLQSLLNSPGNFTASKLKWVKDHEASCYARIHKAMLPGDYIALRLSGETLTTPSGLSEGILWDFQRNQIADQVLQYFGFDPALFPDVVPTCSLQGRVTPEAALATGLKAGTPIGYRAGDQPNNALSLKVLDPGEVAATGGTSGVVYGVVDRPAFDPLSRVNGFAHVNHSAGTPRIGILLCINGAGILYSWLRQYVGHAGISYPEMEAIAASAPIGSDALCILPFGNGAERMLENRNPGASIHNLHFNRHGQAHLFRAGLEGIAFAFAYGVALLRDMGLHPNVLRVGNDNLFQSSVFSETVAHLLDCRIEVVETTGAIGAAKAAGVATGGYTSLQEALGSTHAKKTFEPGSNREPYLAGYERWRENLLKG